MTVGELMVELGRHSTLAEVKMEVKGIEYEITSIDTFTNKDLEQKVLLVDYPYIARNASHFSGGETYANNNNSDG